MDKLPPLSADLVEALHALLPPRCIGANESETDAHRYAGKRALVEYLIALRDRVDPTQAIEVTHV